MDPKWTSGNELNYLKEVKAERNSLKNVITKAKQIVETKMAHDLSKYETTVLDRTQQTEETTFSNVNALIDEINIEVKQPNDESWLFKIKAFEGEGNGVWFDYIAEQTSMWPKEITISWDINHSYSQNTFRSNEKEHESVYSELAPELFKLICYLIIVEETERDDGQENVSLSHWRNGLNNAISDN